jgi:GDP-mannose 6-dehydrogenase
LDGNSLNTGEGTMRISIFGLGYVGCVTGACLAEMGHEVVGVDVDESKVKTINDGKSPVIEKDLDEIIRKVVDAGRLRATCDANMAVGESSLSMICVGTPSNENGSLDLDAVKRVSEQIGAAIREKNTCHTVVLRSTVLPGTVRSFVLPLLEKSSGKNLGSDFGICVNPEFMREGSSVGDFYNPPLIVIGEQRKEDGDLLEEIYQQIEAPIIRTTIEISEMLKYVNNAFHALKIGFSNEIGKVCKKLGIDGQEVMKYFCMDKKLNISEYYFKPGFAFGGSCLPKDLRALLHKSRELDLSLPILSAILPSNKNQTEFAFDLIRRTSKKKICFLGISFKTGTDDLRESPSIELIEMLIGKGFELKLYDKEVSLSKLIGSNKRYIEKTIPHISKLMQPTIEDAVGPSEVIVVTKNSNEFVEILKNGVGKDKKVIDLVGVLVKQDISSEYSGICW